MMLKMVRYLIDNPHVLPLVKKGEVCLVGVSEMERMALIEVLDLHRLEKTKSASY